MKQLVLVEHHLLARFTHNIVHLGEFDRIDRAGFFAHATENTPEHVDLKLRRIFFTVIPRRLSRLDMNAVRGANSGAHHARNTFDTPGCITVESMHAPEVRELHPALLRGIVLSALLRILNRSAGSPLTKRGKEVPQGRAKHPLHDRGDIHRFGRVHRLGRDCDDVFFFNSHIGEYSVFLPMKYVRGVYFALDFVHTITHD